MDDERFAGAVAEALNREIDTHEIGTLSERTVHAALKIYFEPDSDCREIAVGRHVADICRNDEIIEIQTKSFFRLRDKLMAFLPEFKVTVVFPAVTEKRIIWLEPESGELSTPRRSPKRGGALSILPELYGVRELVGEPNLTFLTVFLKVDETHLKCGRSKDRKRFGAKLVSCVPTELCGFSYIRTREDVKKLLPPTLPERFDRRDFDRSIGIHGRNAWYALQVLLFFGIVHEEGKDGRKIIYSISQD